MASSSVARGIVVAALRVALRALRLGAAYGVKIRAPHALVMTLLFGKDRSPSAVWSRVASLAWEHGRNLALFAAAYKAVLAVLRAIASRVQGGGGGSVAAAGGAAPPLLLLPASVAGVCGGVAGACAAALVWRHNTHLNYQLMLYLLSRVVVASVRLLAKSGVAPFASFTAAGTYPYLSVGVWAAVMALYEADSSVLHPSLASSMHDIYRAADAATGSAWDYAPTPATLVVVAHMAHTAWRASTGVVGSSGGGEPGGVDRSWVGAASGVGARLVDAVGRMFALAPSESVARPVARPSADTAAAAAAAGAPASCELPLRAAAIGAADDAGGSTEPAVVAASLQSALSVTGVDGVASGGAVAAWSGGAGSAAAPALRCGVVKDVGAGDA